jgi:aryl-alcohol dehydrogenase-like predicted oxidoreductase
LENRPFGRTGLQVSAIGFGCWEIGGGYGRIDEMEFARAVGRALDLGINCFDTAEGYGSGASERALGKALGRRRGDAIIVTKFGIGYRDKPNSADAREPFEQQQPPGLRAGAASYRAQDHEDAVRERVRSEQQHERSEGDARLEEGDDAENDAHQPADQEHPPVSRQRVDVFLRGLRTLIRHDCTSS